MGAIVNRGLGTSEQVVRNVGAPLRYLAMEFEFGENYPTGGDPINLGSYFRKEILGFIMGPQDGLSFEYERGTKSIVVKDASAGTEVSENDDLSYLGDIPEIQKMTLIAGGGTFDIKSDADTETAIAYNADAGTMSTAVGALSDIETPERVTRTGAGTSEDPFVYKITHNRQQGEAGVDLEDDASLEHVQEVQKLTVSGDGGTFTLGTEAGVDETQQAYDVSHTDLQAALRGLAYTHNLTVTRSGAGTFADPHVYTITHVGLDAVSELLLLDDSITDSGSDEPVCTLEIETAHSEPSVEFEEKQEYEARGKEFLAWGY